ncbi:MAG TPA: hypothetical protein VF719_04435, partial [Abditibacteriaceae bacterium]
GSKTMTTTMEVPGRVPGFNERDGEAVVRREINILAKWAGKDLNLQLGAVDDLDVTFWNGERVGGIGSETPAAHSTKRNYTVPGRLVKAGRNVIAVRIWDHFGSGGLTSLATEMTLSPEAGSQPLLYHPDYRNDFDLGDDPFRYKRW